MSDNNNRGDFIPTEDFPDFVLDPRMSFQIISIIISCYFNRRFTSREMRNEFVRYISFYLFPNSAVAIHEFIRAGFYYSSYQDVVICYRCGYRRGNWQVTDNPNDIHRQFSPTCVQQSTVNIQINDMFQFLREYLRQNPTGPTYLPASSMRTEFSDRESQQTESYEIIRILPQADLPVPLINRPLEDIHYGTFEVRPALIRNQMSEIESRDQSQVHGELVNPLYGQSIPLLSEECPALTYRNHSTNSETNFEQGYENSHATGDYSDSSQDTTELKTVFRQEIQSSKVVERNTNLSQYQRLIKRTPHASSELSSEGLQNGDVLPTELNRNKSYQVQQVTDEGMTPLPEAELLKESQEGDIDTNQKTDINQNIPLTKEILVSSLENEGRSVTNVSSTVDIGPEEEIKENGPVHTLQATRTELREQPNKLQNSKVRIDETARSSEISSGRTETNHSVFKSRLFRENMENPAQFSDQIDQQSDEHQVHLQYNHTSTALMISTDFGQEENVTEERTFPVEEAELLNERREIQSKSYQVREVTDERTASVAKKELHKENQETIREIQIRQITENDQLTLEILGAAYQSTTDLQSKRQDVDKTEESVPPNSQESNQVQEATDENTDPLPKAKLHKETQEKDSNQETNLEREANQDIATHQKTAINQESNQERKVTDERTASVAKTELHNTVQEKQKTENDQLTQVILGQSLGSMQGNNSVPVEPDLHTQNHSPGTIHSIKTKETDRFEHRADVEQSVEQSDTYKDVPGLNYTINNIKM
ncbi:uncharacterized protein LOC132756147 [Ruditapes philippinarum]|uniref:uncharacterized protein LOC132756147 n=1 Tax=Ruditapes philippinarum TaxID=129788 RepID=UPI00295B3747|nr:uncharacterized protein LOC132756147 [Ruditapes philippinarum]